MSVQNARPITDRNEKEKKFTDLADKHDQDKRYAKNCRDSFLKLCTFKGIGKVIRKRLRI